MVNMLKFKRLTVLSLFLFSFFIIPTGMNAQTNPGEDDEQCEVECDNITISCNEDTNSCEENEDYVICDGTRFYCPR
jgi:hypothetical protein